jgi:hypothetical protein
MRVFASKQLLRILFNPRVYKSPSLVPVLSHTNPIHAFPSHFFKNSFNITSRSKSWFFKPCFYSCSHQTLQAFLNFPNSLHFFPFSYFYDLITEITWGRSLLRHCVTSREFAVSMFDGVVGILYWDNPSGRTVATGSTQPLREMSTRIIFRG